MAQLYHKYYTAVEKNEVILDVIPEYFHGEIIMVLNGFHSILPLMYFISASLSHSFLIDG